MAVLEEQDTAEIATRRTYTVVGNDQYMAAWVAAALGISVEEFGDCAACGVISDRRLVAGVVYSDYRILPHGRTMQGSIAAVSPDWATRTVLHQIFAYPFVQMGVTRLWASTARKNKKVRRFLDRLGFRFEGIGRTAYDGKADSAVYAMLAHECKWIR